MSLNEFISWIANSGGGVMIVSWLLERMPWYQSKDAQTKEIIFFGATILVTILAYTVLTYVPAPILAAIAPYFAMVYTVFTSAFLGKAFHLVDKK